MPTYEYRCPKGHEFEQFFRTISGASETLPCPTCGEESIRKVSGGSGLVFKGSGFYITDYGKDGKKDQRKFDPKPSGTGGGESGSTSSGESSGGEKKGTKGSGSDA